MVPGACARVALVGPALADVREVMIEGPSGLMACAAPDRRPRWEASRRRLVWPNGALAFAFSAEDPDSLRGPQFDAAWADELCAWRSLSPTWANLQLALRLGASPRAVATTTPRPLPALKALMAAPDTVVTRAATWDNQAHLPPSFLESVAAAFAGTRLGRQELEGEMIEDAPGALWSRALLEAAYDPDPPALERVVVGVDPPAGEGRNAAACGLVVAGAAGRGAERRAWVLADRSVQGWAPDRWARRAADLAREFAADRVVAEVNQGGALVRALLEIADPMLPVREVRASVGKAARAEPIAALYERGRIRHAGRFPALEDEMAVFGSSQMRASPDRVDALVWALSDLLLTEPAEPRLRRI